MEGQNPKNQNSESFSQQSNSATPATTEQNVKTIKILQKGFSEMKKEAEKLLPVVQEAQNRLKMFFSYNKEFGDQVEKEEAQELNEFWHEQMVALSAIEARLLDVVGECNNFTDTLDKNISYFSNDKSDAKVVNDYLGYETGSMYLAQGQLRQCKDEYMNSFYACQEVVAPDDLTLRAHKSNTIMIRTMQHFDHLDKMYESSQDFKKKPIYNTVRKHIDSVITRLCVDLEHGKKIEQDLMRTYKGQTINGYPVVWDGNCQLPSVSEQTELANIINTNIQSCEIEENFCSEQIKSLHLDNAIVENRRKDN